MQRNPLTDAGDFTVRLSAENLKRFPGLQEAIEGFDAGNRPAGVAAAGWLKSLDVNQPAESVTTLFFLDGALVGFFALANGQAELTVRVRNEYGLRRRTQPAVLLTWIAKSAAHDFDGTLLLEAAVHRALKAAEFSAATLLALDPFDTETAEMWRSRFGFIDSASESPGSELPRLVVPLRAAR